MSYVTSNMRSAFTNHTLHVEADCPTVRAWYLRPSNGGRMQSTLIVETREGIVIMGDMCPKQNGIISTYGYGIDWFAKNRTCDEQYLCSKFLSRVFVPERGARMVREIIVELRRSGSIDKDAARDAWREVDDEGGDFTERTAWDICNRLGTEFDGGYDYDPSDAGWLCAIQQRFAELYVPRQAAVAA